jgi:hypothetical protein
MNTKMNQELLDIVDKHIDNFISKISDQYDIEKEELEELWASNKSSSIQKPIKTTQEVVAKPTPKVVTENNGTTCPYVYAKGSNAGEVCGCKIRSGGTYCSKHKKYEGTEPKSSSKKILPVAKKSIALPVKKQVTPPKQISVILKKHKAIDKLWHPETSLVFKSPQERVVIGKVVENKLVLLTEKDVDLCKANNFRFELKEPEEEELEEEAEEEEEELEEEAPEEEEPEEELESNMAKAVKKITNTKLNTEAKNIKKSISNAINKTNNDAEDVVEILNKLQIKKVSMVEDSDEEFEEEEFEEEEFEEEY